VASEKLTKANSGSLGDLLGPTLEPSEKLPLNQQDRIIAARLLKSGTATAGPRVGLVWFLRRRRNGIMRICGLRIGQFLPVPGIVFAILLGTASVEGSPVKSLSLGDYQQIALIRNQAGDDLRFDLLREDLLLFDARFNFGSSAAVNLAYHGVPTLSYLQQFDSVLTQMTRGSYTDDGFPIDLTALSDLLGTYVDGVWFHC
jgi:hypothetical protein